MIRKLGDQLQIPASRITVFGDHLNDLSMFRVAGRRVAVANAHPDILQIADEVIGTNDEDAVVRYLTAFWSGNVRGRQPPPMMGARDHLNPVEPPLLQMRENLPMRVVSARRQVPFR